MCLADVSQVMQSMYCWEDAQMIVNPAYEYGLQHTKSDRMLCNLVLQNKFSWGLD
jgi:hypothetical protein